MTRTETAYGDACDNCPADFNPDQANVMETNAGVAADGLGDVCDPRPTQSGDSLLFFDGFSSPTLNPAWTDDRSIFTVAGGDLVFDRPGDTTARSLQRGMGTDVLVNTSFTFTAWGIDGNANLNQNLFIGVRGNSSNAGRALLGTSGQHRQQRHQRGLFRFCRRRLAGQTRSTPHSPSGRPTG